MATRGSSVVLGKTYRVRIFALRPGEEPAAEFARFDRADRQRGLHEVRTGDRLTALTDASDSGELYVRIELADVGYAGILLPGTYTA